MQITLKMLKFALSVMARVKSQRPEDWVQVSYNNSKGLAPAAMVKDERSTLSVMFAKGTNRSRVSTSYHSSLKRVYQMDMNM